MPSSQIIQVLQRLLLGVLIVFSSNFNTVLAQGTTTQQPADTTKAVKVIEPVALSNIGTETEKTLRIIREIRSKIQPSKNELELDSLIPLKLLSVEKLKKDIVLEEIQNMNIRQTESLRNDVAQLKNQLDEWRSASTSKTEEINSMKANLDDVKIQWEKTLAQEREEKLPVQVNERIKTNLSEVNSLNKELSNRNNGLLTLQDEITGALIYLDEVLISINKTEESIRSQIFTIDSPPIWHMFDSPVDSLSNDVSADTLTFSNKIANVIIDHNRDFKTFTENYKANIYYHVLFFVILLFLLYYLKSDVAKWSDEKKDAAIKSSLHIISKPFTAALLVTLLITKLFYSEAPGTVLDYFTILLVWPILTVIPGLIPSIPKKYFYIIGGVFFVTQIADYFSDLVILERSLLFIVDLSTIILLISLIRARKSIREADPNVRWGLVFTIIRLTVFLLSISVVSNSLGNTVLSKLLSEGSLIMIYGGIIIYAAVLILRGLVALILQQDKVAQLNMIQNYPDEVKGRTFQIIKWAAVIYWLYLTLSNFEIYEPIYVWVEGLLTKKWLEDGSITISAGSILAFFITLWISLLVSKFIRFILQDEILTHFDMPRGVPGAISMMVRLVLITLGFVLAFSAAKIDMSNITIIFGALGVGIGFGLQNIFNNLVSGLILAFERPIQVGDVIQISTLNLMGEVKEIGIRASTVRTFDGAEVIVPNGNLISNEMINWTLSDHRRRQEIIVGVKYGTDTTKVLEILNKVVPEQENVLKNPAPLIIFIGFGDNSLDFRVLFWTHFEVGMSTKSRVGIAIDEAFKKAGITIPFPQRDLHLESVSDAFDFKKEKNSAKASPVKKSTAASSSQAKKTKK